LAPNDLGHYGKASDFYRVLSEAVTEMADTGFDSAERVAYWVQRIRDAAVRSMTHPHVLEAALAATFREKYRKLIEAGGILKFHPGIPLFTVDRLKPKLRSELDRRLMAARGLIKFNRAAAIERTAQRFSAWATSVPDGGSDAVNKLETKAGIRKALASLPYEIRRVEIDQGHKFVASLNNIIATDGGAIALTWHSHWRQKNYDYREDHKERDGKVYVLRGNWAINQGFMRVDGHQYYDQITAVGEEVNCRCNAVYLYSLRSLPPDMVTSKGRESLARARALIDA
jgi:hypothetical protein